MELPAMTGEPGKRLEICRDPEPCIVTPPPTNDATAVASHEPDDSVTISRQSLSVLVELAASAPVRAPASQLGELQQFIGAALEEAVSVLG
jgi:hypothetical protein